MARPTERTRNARLGDTPRALRGLTPDTHATAVLWRRYSETGDPEAFGGLCEHYAPLAFIMADQLKCRRPALYSEPLEDLVSDGHLGLIRAIRNHKFGTTGGFLTFARLKIRGTIRNEVLSRTWKGRWRASETNAVEQARAQLVQEHGRNPTRAELTDRLSGAFTNPNIQIGDAEGPVCEAAGDDALALRDASTPDPARRVLDAEAVRVAMKGMSAGDRKILRMVLRGEGPTKIAKVLGLAVSAAAQRINGVLWERRTRADLAEYLGVEPARSVPKPKAGGFRPSPSSFPAARRLA